MKKLLFVGMILVLMASFSVVWADQEGNAIWCNSDQYGCWITNEEGGQDYIMFWSESAREYFMGPGSNAVVADPYPAGKMPMQGPSAHELLVQKLYRWVANNAKIDYERAGIEFNEERYMNGLTQYANKLSDEDLEEWVKYEKDYYYNELMK